MFRIAIHHADKDHPHHAVFAWRGAFDTLDEAKDAMSDAKADYPTRDGYEQTVETLFTDGKGNGEWKAVR